MASAIIARPAAITLRCDHPAHGPRRGLALQSARLIVVMVLAPRAVRLVVRHAPHLREGPPA
jgi:hypothetical protein